MGTSAPGHTGGQKSSTCWNAMKPFGPETVAQCSLPCDPAGELGVEGREGERVGRVHGGHAEPDVVGHHSISIAW